MYKMQPVLLLIRFFVNYPERELCMLARSMLRPTK